MEDKIQHLRNLVSEVSDKIMESSSANILSWIDHGFLPEWAIDALTELIEAGRYDEINDRFFRFLAFGTGGMRGRTIGKVPAMAELGRQSEQGTPEHAAVGTNNMNDFNVIRAGCQASAQVGSGAQGDDHPARPSARRDDAVARRRSLLVRSRLSAYPHRHPLRRSHCRRSVHESDDDRGEQ